MRNKEYLGRMATAKHRKVLQKAIERAKVLHSTFGEKATPLLRTHEGADPDGIGAMKFLQGYLEARYQLASHIYTGPILFTSRPLANRLAIDAVDVPTTEGMLFVLDTCAKPLLNGNDFVRDRTTVIDHHVPDITSIDAAFMVRNPNAVSTCEMLASLVPLKYINEEGAFALAVGIASDTERLRVAERRTIAIFERLLRIAKVKRSDVDELADPAWDPRRVLAIGSDMKNVLWDSYLKNGKEWVFAVGLSTIEMPFVLADALRKLNTNISVALSEIAEGRFKLSVRIGFAEADQTGVHANDIARVISLKLDLPQEQWGGGEIDRAGAIVVGSIERIVNITNLAITEVIDAAARKIDF
ncbi:MAG: DHH family phosphoesterase [Candidatus Micrarchaeota archaeon]